MAEEATQEQGTSNGVFINPPVSQNNSVYPYCKVEKTLSGHQFEVDDTWGSERIKRMHCTGTSEEFDASGNRIVSIMGEDYEIILRGKQMFVKGGLNIVVLEGDAHITSNNDLTITTHGDLNMNVAGNRRTRIGGNDYLDVTGEIGIRAGEGAKTRGVNGAGNIKIECYDYEEKIKGTFNSSVNKKANVTWNWTGDETGGGEEPVSPLDGTNEFWVGKNLNTNVVGKHVIATKEIDIRATGFVPGDPGYFSANDGSGINMTSGTGFTIGTGVGEALTIETGDLNLKFGDINLVIGNINTGYGSISAPLGGISGAAVSAGESLTKAGEEVVPGPHSG